MLGYAAVLRARLDEGPVEVVAVVRHEDVRLQILRAGDENRLSSATIHQALFVWAFGTDLDVREELLEQPQLVRLVEADEGSWELGLRRVLEVVDVLRRAMASACEGDDATVRGVMIVII
jgi:hypothetical protein